jgi:hypothetical protein
MSNLQDINQGDIDKLKDLGFRVYGRFWKGQLATATGYTRTSISRWASGKVKIPKLLLEFLEMKAGQ